LEKEMSIQFNGDDIFVDGMRFLTDRKVQSMGTNYFVKKKVDNEITEELLGTRHFTAGKKVFTFIMPIKDFIMRDTRIYAVREEDRNVVMTIGQFNKSVIAECDTVIYEKDKP
jgi:hypothetical protein